MKKEERKVLFNKGGNGGITARVSLPIEFLRELGIDKDNNIVYIEKEEDKIIIKKESKGDI